MANIIEIQNAEAPELNVYCRLTEAQLRSKQHPESGMFIAEGVKVIEHALDAGLTPLSLLMARKHILGKARTLLERCGSIDVYTGSDTVLEAITGFTLSRGILCAMHRPGIRSPSDLCTNARRLAVLEGISDPTNAGAIFRSAAALGVDGVLLSPNCCDPLNRRTVRVSMGTVFQIPWARMESWPEKGLTLLRKAGFLTAALALTDNSLAVDDPSLAAQERLAIVLGAEGDGLSPSTIAHSDFVVRIPMCHGVDSLNVAAASAVAFWQL